MLDEILGNPTELPVAEHTTDTHGQTLATFGLFDLLGLQFSPHVCDLTRLQLYRLGTAGDHAARWPRAGPLLTQPVQTRLVVDHWDDLLRFAGSMKFGHAAASLLVAKLHAGGRQEGLARALHEYGRLVRTIYVWRYLTDLELRRRVRRQLNKGESLHAGASSSPTRARCAGVTSTTRSTRGCAPPSSSTRSSCGTRPTSATPWTAFAPRGGTSSPTTTSPTQARPATTTSTRTGPTPSTSPPSSAGPAGAPSANPRPHRKHAFWRRHHRYP